MQTIEQIIARWDSGEGKPYKGRLIDWAAYGGDGVEPPTDIGCCCAQGQVLCLLGGWTPRSLKDADQSKADLETAKLLSISRAHAILLRQVNDSVDGAPSIVLTAPEKILGEHAQTILKFWLHLDTLDAGQWATARDAAQAAARDAARDAAQAAAWAAAWAAARDAAGDAAWDAAWDAAGDAAGAAARATAEIQGAAILRSNGQPFLFLPAFGFATPEDIHQRSPDTGS